MPEAALSQMAVYSARPTVRIDGQEYPMLSDLLIAMEMHEHEGGMSSLDVRLSNFVSTRATGAELAFEDEQIVRLGATISVYAGDINAPQEIFQGVITGLEADFPEKDPPELSVLAEDVFQQARMARRTQVHDNVSVADLATSLAGQLSLTPVVAGLTDKIGSWVQLNESDLAFLRRILARYDADMQVVGTELHVSPRQDVQRGSVALELHSQLRHARVVADLAHQVTEVTVSGWNSQQGQRVSATSQGGDLGPGSGRTGAQLLDDTLGARSEHSGHLAVTTEAEAQALAEAAFDRRARRLTCVQATAEGNPAIRVGSHVSLSGLSPRLDNTYYVVRACHHYDEMSGYETDFEAECGFLGEA